MLSELILTMLGGMLKNQTKIGFIGLGKLGLPCAAALSASTGITIHGYDVNKDIKSYIQNKSVPYLEQDIEHFLMKSNLIFEESVERVVSESELVFLAVQTPHDVKYEGISPIPDNDKDFDYTYLEKSIDDVVAAVKMHSEKIIDLVIISTVLPGTIKSRIEPRIPSNLINRINLIYNPFFIAMGSTIPDYLNPEFILIGKRPNQDVKKLVNLYKSFISSPLQIMNIESAELTKVAYNTFIGFKIIFSNMLSEIVQKTGGNVDEVTNALASSDKRLMSKKYLNAGMGDGGGCHPRDQIAMSWLAESLKLGYNPFRWIAETRDHQTKNQALLINKIYLQLKIPVVLMGRAYKKNINLETGSPSILLSYFLDELKIPHEIHDPYIEKYKKFDYQTPCIFFISTDHDKFKNYIYPKDSICIDPWGYLVTSANGDVKIIKPGRDLNQLSV